MNGYFVDLVAPLQNEVQIMGMKIPLYKMLQHISSLIGGSVILFAILNLPRNDNVVQKMTLKYWMTLMIITIAVVGVRFSFGFNIKQFGNIVVSLISALLIALVVGPLVVARTK